MVLAIIIMLRSCAPGKIGLSDYLLNLLYFIDCFVTIFKKNNGTNVLWKCLKATRAYIYPTSTSSASGAKQEVVPVVPEPQSPHREEIRVGGWVVKVLTSEIVVNFWFHANSQRWFLSSNP